MGMKKTSAKITSNLPAGISLGLLVSILFTLISAAGITQLVTKEKIAENNIGYLILAVLLLSTMVGAWTAVIRTKRLRLQVCLLEGAGYFLAMLAIAAMFFGGRYQGVLPSAMTILTGCLLVAFLPAVGKHRINRKTRAYR